MTLRSLMLLLSILFVSCSYSDKYFYLNEDERAFLKPFHKGDTLFYENDLNDIDTILVLGIDSNQKKQPGYVMALPAYNEISISIKHIPINTFYSIYSDNIVGKVDTTFNQLITIRKLPQDRKVEYSFQFKNFLSTVDNDLGKLHRDTIINGRVIKNYYVIQNDWLNNQTASNDVKYLYWAKDKGLIGYQCNDGSCWIRKNNH